MDFERLARRKTQEAEAAALAPLPTIRDDSSPRDAIAIGISSSGLIPGT